MRLTPTIRLLLKAFALACVSIRGLAIDGHESRFLERVEAGESRESGASPSGARDPLLDVLGTSMIYLTPASAEAPRADRVAPAALAESHVRVEIRARSLFRPPCG